MGDRLGEWTLEELIGKGGMGRVFLARNDAGSVRAVKIIRREERSWSTMRSFVDEAMVAVRIQHANVVRTFELGEHEGTFFLVMEYVPGCSLHALLKGMAARERALDPRLAAWIACEIAAGLEAAHGAHSADGEAMRIVHRDVSPQNILLGPTGSVKLTDFGIAKAMGRAERTQTGVIKGKLRYMAPEQALAKPVDVRTDLYSLGLVLWQMLTMRRPFADLAKAKLLRAVQRGGVPPASEFVEEIPLAIDTTVATALASDPALRPASAAAFADRLKSVVPSHGDAVAAITTLLFEFAKEDMLTASLRSQDATEVETVGAKAKLVSLSSAEATRQWTRPAPDAAKQFEEPEGWSASSSASVLRTSDEIPIPRRKQSVPQVAVISFIVGIVVAVGIMLMLR